MQKLEEALEAAMGKQETATDEISAPLARRLAATLGKPAEGLENGASLPEGWHVILFTPDTPTDALTDDGHPRKGDFLPDLPLPRRMFAGRTVNFEQPLEIGTTVQRVSTISNAEIKEGRSGLLAFVTITHDIMSGDALCVREEQTLVYRDEGKDATAKPKVPEQAPADCPWRNTMTPTPALLFRYSAITFNAHRIHYDESYVRDVEGYPERVSNGGLTAIFLMELARANRAGPIQSFSVTNRRALYVNRPVTCLGKPEGDGAQLWAIDDTGAIASKASLTWKAS